MTLADQQQPVVLADRYHTAPLISSVQVETDLVPHKLVAENQYSYRRSQHLKSWKANTGPLGKMVLGGKEPGQVFRMRPGPSLSPTQPMLTQAQHLARVTKVARAGGVVMAVASTGVACHQIGSEKDRGKKNKLFVEHASSVAGGAGAVAMLALAVTPVGWAGILAVATAGAIAGYATGKAGSRAYDRFGKEYDLVDVLFIDEVCGPD